MFDLFGVSSGASKLKYLDKWARNWSNLVTRTELVCIVVRVQLMCFTCSWFCSVGDASYTIRAEIGLWNVIESRELANVAVHSISDHVHFLNVSVNFRMSNPKTSPLDRHLENVMRLTFCSNHRTLFFLHFFKSHESCYTQNAKLISWRWQSRCLVRTQKQ